MTTYVLVRHNHLCTMRGAALLRRRHVSQPGTADCLTTMLPPLNARRRRVAWLRGGGATRTRCGDIDPFGGYCSGMFTGHVGADPVDRAHGDAAVIRERVRRRSPHTLPPTRPVRADRQ